MKACQINFVVLISFIISSECNIYYLDDICRNSRDDLSISVPSVGLQSTGEVKSSRRGIYSLGRNCSFKITSVYGLIINVRQVQFRPGCHDYIKISDGERNIALCGSKNDLDENMQYYGQSIRIHYFTHAAGRTTHNLEGVSMIYTATAGLPCDTLRNFLCDNGYCIYKGFICDGYNNCGDYSDERSCQKTSAVVITAVFLVSVLGLFGGFCISMALIAVFTDIFRAYRERGANRCSFCCSSESATSQACQTCC